jgi:hypothetical protein
MSITWLFIPGSEINPMKWNNICGKGKLLTKSTQFAKNGKLVISYGVRIDIIIHRRLKRLNVVDPMNCLRPVSVI